MSTPKSISNRTPYELENLRDMFARNKKIDNFLELYKKETYAIRNENTGKLWNSKFEIQKKISEQDRMTQEKIFFIADEIVKIESKVELLDIGIGQAYLEQVLKKRHVDLKLSAIDISELSIQRAKKNYNAIGIVDDALEMSRYFKAESFDAIVAIEVIEHISPHKIFSFYKQVHSLLKDGGLFIISTPLNEGLSYMKNNPNAHVREYTESILKLEFSISKFEILKTKQLIAFHRFYTVKKFISKILNSRWKPNNIIIVARKV